MFKIMTLTLLLFFVGAVDSVKAQDADERAHDLAASLDKTKYKKKQRANFTMETFLDIKNEPVVVDPSEYSGVYKVDGFRLELNAEKGGTASASGYDTYPTDNDEKRVDFTLTNAKIDGALLTGTKVYASGESIPFEAVFVNRTSRTGTDPDHVTSTETTFGLGFIQNDDMEYERQPGSGWPRRVFLEKQ